MASVLELILEEKVTAKDIVEWLKDTVSVDLLVSID